MKSTSEWATTRGEPNDNPTPPFGDNWRLVSAVSVGDRWEVFWYWERTTPFLGAREKPRTSVPTVWDYDPCWVGWDD